MRKAWLIFAALYLRGREDAVSSAAEESAGPASTCTTSASAARAGRTARKTAPRSAWSAMEESTD